MNPLEHYLIFGNREGRNPNRIFNVAWYRDRMQGRPINKRMEIDPLTHYTAVAFHARPPAPCLGFLAKPMTKLSVHGPKKLIDALDNNRNIYAGAVSPFNIIPGQLIEYMPAPLHDYNQDLPESILLLPKQRIGVMYSARCGSVRLVYWWLQQKNLLDVSLRFTIWPHDFETMYRGSRENIAAALSFQPEKYLVYKFVRHPVSRMLSTFRHFLQVSRSYGFTTDKPGISFHEFLDAVHATDYFAGNTHCAPQLTKLEIAGRIQPTVIKIEDGFNAQLHALEAKHGLPKSDFDLIPEIKRLLRGHTVRPLGIVSAKPDTQIRFGSTPDDRRLLNDGVRQKIFALYRADFDAYGYAPDDAI
jgi:hypothetical protein